MGTIRLSAFEVGKKYPDEVGQIQMLFCSWWKHGRAVPARNIDKFVQHTLCSTPSDNKTKRLTRLPTWARYRSNLALDCKTGSCSADRVTVGFVLHGEVIFSVLPQHLRETTRKAPTNMVISHRHDATSHNSATLQPPRRHSQTRCMQHAVHERIGSAARVITATHVPASTCRKARCRCT